MSARTLEFAVFCIESIAHRLGVSGTRVYDALAQRSDMLNDYIVANYEALHTQDREYIVDDILNVMANKGIVI